MKYVCVGHATYDTTLPVDKYPIENKKIRLSNKQECGGGPASNAAYLLAKWGCNVGFVGIVGNDYYGQCIMKEFNSIGVNTDYLEKKSGIKTDSSYIISNLEKNTQLNCYSYAHEYHERCKLLEYILLNNGLITLQILFCSSRLYFLIS